MWIIFTLSPIQDLEARKTYACGTICTNQGEFPKAIKEASLDVGDSVFIKMNNIVAVHWKDKRDAIVMSTIHGNSQETIKRYKEHITMCR